MKAEKARGARAFDCKDAWRLVEERIRRFNEQIMAGTMTEGMRVTYDAEIDAGTDLVMRGLEGRIRSRVDRSFRAYLKKSAWCRRMSEYRRPRHESIDTDPVLPGRPELVPAGILEIEKMRTLQAVLERAGRGLAHPEVVTLAILEGIPPRMIVARTGLSRRQVKRTLEIFRARVKKEGAKLRGQPSLSMRAEEGTLF